MNEKDLMTGDFVCYCKPNGYYCKVLGIRPSSDGDEDNYAIIAKRDEKDPRSEQNKKFYELFSVNILHPIPLTPEILKKNGFKKDAGGEECWSSKIGWLTPHEYDDNFKEKSWEVELFGKPNSFDGVITYLHELQHVLRLCGVKKNIVL